LVERLADADVLERVLALDVTVLQLVPDLVEAEEDGAQLRPLIDLDALGRADALDVLRRHRVHHVDLAREQRRHSGRIVADASEHRLGDVVLGLVPPARVGDEDRLHLGLALLQHEGPGAVGVARGVEILVLGQIGRLGGVVLLRPRLAHDVEIGDLLGEDRVGSVGHHLDRVVVDLVDRFDRRHHRLEVGALHADAVEGEQHVVGGEGRAVLELDALAQLEAPDLGRDLTPFRRQDGHRLQRLVAPDQRLVDIAHEGEEEGLVAGVGIHRVDIAVIGEAERLGLGRSQAANSNHHGANRRENP